MKSDNTIAVILVIAIVLVWALSGALLYCNPERGTFGDMFGAVNALFSGLGFAGVLYALLLQRRELDLSKSAAKQNAEGQENAAKLQALTLMFGEYKQLAAEKDVEINRLSAANPPGGLGSGNFYETLLRERDDILRIKYKIFQELELAASINR